MTWYKCIGGNGGQPTPVSLNISYLKWKITKLRSSPAANAIQVSEFYLYQKGVLYQWNANVSITSDLTPVSANESADKLIDGNINTKYCSTQWGSSATGECNIVISLGETITIDDGTTYSYVTAEDEPSRDPIVWTLYGSSDGINWKELDTVAEIFISRHTETGQFGLGH